MYGDYEAQRHWMEITTALPLNKWYVGDDRVNDISYWGLDYPPLTAYVSYMCGLVAQTLDPEMVAPFSSRGYESPGSKAFMRFTVVCLDVLVYFTAAWSFCSFAYGSGGSGYVAKAWACFKRDKRNYMFACETFLLLLLSPGIILIDHGHFQYNCVSLGLVVAAVAFLHKDRRLAASVSFCLSLNFKQMSLYYAPAIFFYLLSHVVWDAVKASRTLLGRFGHVARGVAELGAVVLATFALHWIPFCFDEWDWVGSQQCGKNLLAVLKRLFDFNRGVFEDKVANVWCSLSPVFKVKNMERHFMVALCLGATIVSLAPMAIDLMRRRPSPPQLVYALFNSSIGFFLFSYQVHEKGILMPLLLSACLMGVDPFPNALFAVVATFSMSPLLLRDGLAVPYFVTLFVFLGTFALVFEREFGQAQRATGALPILAKLYVVFSLLIMMVLHILHACVDPPARYPHLWIVFIEIFSCAQFLAFAVYTNVIQFTLNTTPGRKVRKVD